ncbi:hypothetical protein [Actinomadura chibensis]|uniref:DUF304 domain-containing protein n=1 Tax=Actinomadura chibensis TaxID=392828 RepID=A0A5D0NWS9_9ACTN|nr:hypothetical protein [Actinomadura chibensis]TYB48664.1 hypothetical protein FXF69_05645 [Actinomadura chibensis]
MLTRGGAFRSAIELVPYPVRRIMGFDAKGLVSLVLLAGRRRHGVPKGAVALSYSGAQTTLQLAFLFAMLLETVVVELLLRGVDAPGGLRAAVLMIDVYSILIVVAVIAACVTRPHVLSDGELRIRYGAFFDLRVPRGSISAVRIARNYDERGMVRVRDGKLSVAVAAQTNVVVELDAPITVVRPLGGRDTARTIRFYADDPAALTAVLAAAPDRLEIQESAGRRDAR